MILDTIRDFPKQFDFKPSIKNHRGIFAFNKFVVCGMGGSNLAGALLKAWKPKLDIYFHRDYGLPPLSSLKERLIICCSYSGNTEETLEAFEEAKDKGLEVVVITTGGKLLERAIRSRVPYIELPRTGQQPRTATGYLFLSLLAFTDPDALAEAYTLKRLLDSQRARGRAEALARNLVGKVPVVYASDRNAALATNWKIKFNENGKTPAFCNIFPELNHNEMNGFDAGSDATKRLSENFAFMFLKDEEDHPKIQKRMEVLERLYQSRGLAVEIVPLTGTSRLEKIFQTVMMGDWISCFLAGLCGIDPEPVPMVEEFKLLISS